MSRLFKGIFAAAQRDKIQRLLRESPSPSLAENHLLRLLEASSIGTIKKIRSSHFSELINLLGSSSFLSDVLIRQGEHWPEVFLRQIKVRRKTAAENLMDLNASIRGVVSFDDFARAAPVQAARIPAHRCARSGSFGNDGGNRQELTALADASLEAAYRYGRAEVEKEYGTLLLPGKPEHNGFVVLGMGKLGGAELNFSSDIDVIFLFGDDEGESSGGRKGKLRRESFQRHWTKIIQAMGTSPKTVSSFASICAFVPSVPTGRSCSR
jgi:glutamine synthetase adenylyltransferase